MESSPVDRILNTTSLTGILENETSSARRQLADMDLDSICKPSQSLPAGLAKRINKAMQLGGVEHIRRLLKQLGQAGRESQKLVDDMKAELAGEERDDRESRARHPQLRDHVPESRSMNGQLSSTIENMDTQLRSSKDVDAAAGRKADKNDAALQMIGAGVENVAKYGPRVDNAMADSPEGKVAVAAIMQARNRLEEIFAKRQGLVGRLRNPDGRGVSHCIAVLHEANGGLEKQQQAMDAVVTNFEAAQKGLKSYHSARKQFLEGVENALRAYEMIVQSAEQGLQWHTQFQTSARGHVERVSQFRLSRRMSRDLAVG